MPSKTVDAYLKTVPKDARIMLEQMRAIILKIVPQAEEKISYGMPMYKHMGALVGFAAWKNHVALYAWNNTFVEAHKAELKKYTLSKGTIQFPIGEKLPVTLIKKFVTLRKQENESKAAVRAKKKTKVTKN